MEQARLPTTGPKLTKDKHIWAHIHEFYLDGEYIRRVSTGSIIRGTRTPRGYRTLSVGPKKKRANVRYHRLKFALAHGWLPPVVDHADTNTDNNLLGNLRAATHVQNGQNHRLDKKRLPRGVALRPAGNYQARAYANGKPKHLGMFDDPAEASRVVEAYLKALHGEFYRAPV